MSDQMQAAVDAVRQVRITDHLAEPLHLTEDEARDVVEAALPHLRDMVWSETLLSEAEFMRKAEADGYLFLAGARVPWEAVARHLEVRAKAGSAS